VPVREGPSLDRLAILDEHGGRKKVQPADVDGRFERLKPFVRWFFIAIFIVLPWIEVGGGPAVLFDLPARRFHLFGLVLGTGDLPFLFFLLIAVAWILVVTTALFGRVWCGWACPQTVTLEAVFRRVERVIEGTGHQRLAFDLAPWTAKKAAKKALKWAVWAAASFIIAHVFLSYFVSLPRVAHMVLDDPRENWAAFLISTVVTVITYANFAWFREQVCLIICPYGRLQSALHDNHSLVIGYDLGRGEPRGKKSEGRSGDCVDCGRCVQVCPTGIDIRNGLQMECIGCAACVDACDAVMLKIGKPVGLVRYDSSSGLAGEKRRLFRPRIAAYLVVGAVLFGAFAVFVATRTPFVVRVMRTAAPFTIIEDGARVQNVVMVHVENRSSDPIVVKVGAAAASSVFEITSPMASLSLDSQERADLPLLIRAPRDKPTAGMLVPLVVTDEAGRRVAASVAFLAPPPVPVPAAVPPAAPSAQP